MPNPIGRTCDHGNHAWSDAMLCRRCGTTMKEHALRYPWRDPMVAERQIAEIRRLTPGPVAPAPPDPVRTVLSILPNLLLAWALIWMRWILPPEEDL